MQIPSDIKKKYGPLPLWAWGLIALVVIYGAMMLRNRSANASAFGGQSPKSNLGTTTDGSGSGGSLAIPYADSLPNTAVSQNAVEPPYMSPVVSNTSAAPTPQLQSAPLTAFGSVPLYPVVSSQDEAYRSSTPASYQNPDGSWSNFEGALPTWDSPSPLTIAGGLDPAIATALGNGPAASLPTRTIQDVTQKILPVPIDPTPRPTIGHNVAV